MPFGDGVSCTLFSLSGLEPRMFRTWRVSMEERARNITTFSHHVRHACGLARLADRSFSSQIPSSTAAICHRTYHRKIDKAADSAR